MKFLNPLSASFTRLKNILLHARQMYEGEKITQFDAVLVVGLLMLLTILQKVLWAVQANFPVSAIDVLQPVFLAVLLGWGGLSTLIYYVARLAKHQPDFVRIAVLTGAAGLPLMLTTLLSVLITLTCLILGVIGNLDSWQLVHNLIGWIGIILGWPGYLGSMALQMGAMIKKTSALAISLVLVLLLLLGTWLPVWLK